MQREVFHPTKLEQASQSLAGIRSPTGQVAKPPPPRTLPNGVSCAAQDAVARCQVDPWIDDILAC